MDTPEEADREQWYHELVDDISKEAISEFTLERLRSYYIANNLVAKNALAMFKEAESLLDSSPSASLVLFTTSIEVGLKVVLLKPVIYGLIHNESVADLIAELSVRHNGFDRFKPVLARILAEYGRIDFNAFAIEGHAKTIWEEITLLQNARNGIVHRAELAQRQTADLSCEVATMIIGILLPSVLEGLGLKFEVGGLITDS